jgi:hypothetical protein
MQQIKEKSNVCTDYITIVINEIVPQLLKYAKQEKREVYQINVNFVEN